MWRTFLPIQYITDLDSMGGLNLKAFLSKAIHLFKFCFKFWHLFGIDTRAKVMRIYRFLRVLLILPAQF